MCIQLATSGILSLTLMAHMPVPTNCDSLPVLQISDPGISRAGDAAKTERVIDGTVTKDSARLQFAAVRLYSGKKVVRQTRTDAQGHFVLKNLSMGRYTLSIQDMGNFRIEITAPHFSQQKFYSFSGDQGCLSWGFSTD
jgi:hypothetical protein